MPPKRHKPTASLNKKAPPRRKTVTASGAVADVGARVLDFATSLATGALRVASMAGVPMRLAEALLLTPEQLKLLSPRKRTIMRQTGLYLQDLREVAGLTVSDLSKALDLNEHSLLVAAEDGTATLSFELILRLAGLLARHDPVPFVMRLTRAHQPALWKILEEWGAARIPVQFERERQFLNLYRSHDSVRRLSDDSFDEVLRFTQSAFELALHFALEGERREVKKLKRPLGSGERRG